MFFKSIENKIKSLIYVFIIFSNLLFGQTNIEVVPGSKNTLPARTFSLDIKINNVTNLHSASVTLSFNNALIRYDGLTQGPFLSGAIQLSNPNPGPTVSTVTIDQAILGPGTQSGSGVLFSINFTSQQLGNSSVTIVASDLRDGSNNYISHTKLSGQVNIGFPSVVYVNPSYTPGNSGGYEFGYNAFNNISSGVDAVTAGGTVNIGQALYNETVNLNKNITFNSSGIPSIQSVSITSNSTLMLNNNFKITNSLSLLNGFVNSGNNIFEIGESGSVTRVNGHIIGKLQKYISTGSPNYIFEIGDPTNYTPVEIVFDNVSTAGKLTAFTVNTDHPNINISGIYPTKSVNRYYSLSNNGIGFTSCSPTFNFAAGDIDAGANYNNFVVKKYTGTSWESTITGTRTPTSIQALGVTSFSDFAIGEVILPPNSPVALPATNITESGFVANWNSVSGADEYRLDVSADNFNTFIGSYNNFRVVGTSQSVSGLNQGTQYSYRVRAVNVGGTSPNSNVINVTTVLLVPNPPIALSATNITQTTFRANWGPVSGASSYRIDVSTDNFFTFVGIYNNMEVSGTNIDVTGLTPNTQYVYRVRAANLAGSSVNSNTITVRTLILPPAAPVALEATEIGETSFIANWEIVQDADEYRLDISPDNFITFFGAYNDFKTTNVSQLVSGLNPNTQYFYRIRAINAGGSSNYSNTISVKTILLPPTAPIALPATNITRSSFTAKWRAVDYTDYYRLDLSKDNFLTFVSIYNNYPVYGTSLDIFGLEPETEYMYRVRAINISGTSSNSNAINVITTAICPEWTERYNNGYIDDMGFKIPTIAKKMTRNLFVDNQGNIYVAGYSQNKGTKYDYVTIKYNASGNILWEARYNCPANKDDKAYAISVDGKGNVYVTGESDGGFTKMDILTVKYSTSGEEIWTSRWNNPRVAKRDAGYAIALSSDGRYVYVTGETDNRQTKADIITIAYDAETGEQLWENQFDGLAHKNDKAYAIAFDPITDEVVITGESDGGATKADYIILKYSGGQSGGNKVWSARYDYAGKKDYPFALAIDDNSNIYVTGGSEGPEKFDYMTIKYGPNGGNPKWVSRYNNEETTKNDVAYALTLDSENNIYVTGASEGLETRYDFATIKYNSNGMIQWENRWESEIPKDDISRSIVVNEDLGLVFVAGSSDQGLGRKLDIATQCLSLVDGSEEWFGLYNGPGNKNDIAYNVCVKPVDGCVIVSGISDGYATKIDFVTFYGAPGSAVPENPMVAAVFDGYDEQDEECEGMPKLAKIYQNYPNPFNPSTTIEFRLDADAIISLKIYNVIGQEILLLAGNEIFYEGLNRIEFYADNLPSGIYIYQIFGRELDNKNSFISDIKKMILLK